MVLLSLSARLRAVEEAMWARNHGLLDDTARWYPQEVFDEHVVARRGQKLYRVPWTRTEDGTVSFGEPEEVAQEYVPVERARVSESRGAGISSAKLVEAANGMQRGLKWDVEIIAPGWSLNKLYYRPAVLGQAATLFEGARVYVFPDTSKGHKTNTEDKHLRYLGGWLENVRQADGGILEARLNFLAQGEHADTVAKLVEAWDRGKRDLFGLSIHADGSIAKGLYKEGGKQGRLVEAIVGVDSVDVVIDPAAGGKFTRLMESTGNHPRPENTEMTTRVQRMLRILEARRPAALDGIDRTTVSADDLLELMTPAELQEAFTPEPAADAPPAASGSAELQEALNEVRVERSQTLATRMIQESLLLDNARRIGGEPASTALQKRLDRRFAGQVLTREQIQEALDDERDFLAVMHPTRASGLGAGGAPGGGNGGVDVGASPEERIERGLLRRMLESIGMRVEGDAATATRCGLREAYTQLTRGADPNVTGVLQESVEVRDGQWGTREMLREAITGQSFPRVMANVLHQVLLAAYREIDYGEQHLITARERAEDFREYETINVGGFPDLSDFADPNGTANYQEIGVPVEESEKYKVGTKGNILTVTRETIINDKAGVVARLTQMLGQAARRTHARFVFNRVLLNPLLSDGLPLFHASRGNLRTAPYSIDELEAIDQVLYDMTNAGGHDKLGLEVYQVFMGRALRKTARSINSSPQVPGSANNDANDWHQHFGEKHERIRVSPFITDPQDFLTTAAPGAVGGLVEMRYLFGQEEPEFFTADNPAIGQMLVGDRLQKKVRHEYGGRVPAGAWRAFVLNRIP